jgi:hypothetical protein
VVELVVESRPTLVDLAVVELAVGRRASCAVGRPESRSREEETEKKTSERRQSDQLIFCQITL